MFNLFKKSKKSKKTADSYAKMTNDDNSDIFRMKTAEFDQMAHEVGLSRKIQIDDQHVEERRMKILARTKEHFSAFYNDEWTELQLKYSMDVLDQKICSLYINRGKKSDDLFDHTKYKCFQYIVDHFISNDEKIKSITKQPSLTIIG